MSVRPFDWRDLPVLHRYRNQILFLDSIRLLTQGPALIPAGVLFSYFAPATGIFTYRYKGNGGTTQNLLGQVLHPTGSALARLSFLTPVMGLESASLAEMLEMIAFEIGKRGAYHLLAEVEEQDEAFEHLRKVGFAIYARQRIWQLTGVPIQEAYPTPWKIATSHDLLNVRTLYCNLVPGLVQQVEPPPLNRPHGMVYYDEKNELRGFVEIKYGPKGIWLQPFIHPDAEQITGRLADMLKNLTNGKNRPVYLCVRTYQSWLETAIEDLGAEASPRQAVMVKRLAIPQKATRAYSLPALEGGQPEITATITRSKSN
jgi:hypothetical protein